MTDLATQPPAVLEQAATLLVEGFDEPRGWPTLALAREEVATVLRIGFARAAVNGDLLVGWIGGLPEYGGRVWELHPMVVRREYRRRRIVGVHVGAEPVTRRSDAMRGRVLRQLAIERLALACLSGRLVWASPRSLRRSRSRRRRSACS